MWKWILTTALVMGLAVLEGGSPFAIWPGPARITRQNCDRVREGMTMGEVEAILGPPGDYATEPTRGYMGSGPQMMPWTTREWVTDETVIWVDFDAAGKATGKQCSGNCSLNAGAVDTLRWRAKRLWHRLLPEQYAQRGFAFDRPVLQQSR
jgi:hypothetical protein